MCKYLLDLGLLNSFMNILKMKDMGKNNVVKLVSKPVINLRFEIYLVLELVKSCTGQAQQER